MLTRTDINQRTVQGYVTSTFCVDLSNVLAQLIQFSSVHPIHPAIKISSSRDCDRLPPSY